MFKTGKINSTVILESLSYQNIAPIKFNRSRNRLYNAVSIILTCGTRFSNHLGLKITQQLIKNRKRYDTKEFSASAAD